MTRAQACANNTVVLSSDASEEDNSMCDGLGNTLSEELFEQRKKQKRPLQSQRHLNRHRHAKESLKNTASEWMIMDMTPTKFEAAQREGPTLEAPRRAAEGTRSLHNVRPCPI